MASGTYSKIKEFEDVLETTTSRGSNNVPGANMAVIDKDGDYGLKILLH